MMTPRSVPLRWRGLSWILLAIAVVAARTPWASGQPFDRKTPVVIAVKRVGPAVVNILTTRLEQRHQWGYWFNPRAPRTYRNTSLGSGVIIDPVGLVVTNEHVVRNATEIKVHLSDGRILKARRIEQAIRSLDLALLQIEADPNTKFPAVKLGRSHDIMVGETVIALGNPFGLENTVTTGVISAKNRTIRAPLGSRLSYNNLLQTDASINPGNSGGALVNINGELIGINTAVHSQGEGIGFAIPVDAVRASVIHLLELEIGSRGESLGLGVSEHEDGHVRVANVLDKSPAARAGIRAGDLLHALGKRPVRSRLEYSLAVYATLGTTDARLLIQRADKKQEVVVSRPKNHRQRIQNFLAERLRLATEGEAARHNRLLSRHMGITGVDLDTSLKRMLQLPRTLEGVVVLRLDKNGPAASLGLQRYDVILGFGNLIQGYRAQLPVRSVQELAGVIKRIGHRRGVNINVFRRDEDVMFGTIELRE